MGRPIDSRDHDYGRAHRALETGSIVFVLGALGWLAYRTATSLNGPGDIVWVALALLGAYLISDFISGFVHWAGDTVGDETTPVFGPNFVRPFRHHHVDQLDITRHDFIEVNGNNCIVVTPVLLLIIAVMPRATGAPFYTCVVVGATSFFVFCTNQFHKWAHMTNPPAFVRGLQRARLILSPEHHAIHHAAPQDKYYCITVGWMNPILHRVRFFRLCEALIARVYPRALRARSAPQT
jgi:ubiquitin-conjugating enzyme E2 variant